MILDENLQVRTYLCRGDGELGPCDLQNGRPFN